MAEPEKCLVGIDETTTINYIKLQEHIDRQQLEITKLLLGGSPQATSFAGRF